MCWDTRRPFREPLTPRDYVSISQRGWLDEWLEMDDFVIAASDEAKKLHNPIRSIVDDRKMSTNPEKEMLNLTVGKFSPEVGHRWYVYVI